MKVGELTLILTRSGVKPTKRRGQSFLIDENIVKNEIMTAKVRKEDTVLEIGPGPGILTRQLCKRAGRVIAIELEDGLYEYLNQTLATEYDNLKLIHGDVLNVNIPPFNKVVSNIPYSISSPILFNLARYDFENAVLIVQDEFGRRLTALPGMKEYSRLSVMVQIRFEVEELFTVPKSCFYPRPDVNSMAIKLTPLPPKDRPDIQDMDLFSAVVRSIFSQRRKKMRNCLSLLTANVGIDKNELLNMVSNVNPEILDLRGESLYPSEIADIANKLYENGLRVIK